LGKVTDAATPIHRHAREGGYPLTPMPTLEPLVVMDPCLRRGDDRNMAAQGFPPHIKEARSAVSKDAGFA